MSAKRKLIKDTPQILVSYRNGWTIRQLSAFHSVSPGTIRNILIREKEPLRSRGRRKT